MEFIIFLKNMMFGRLPSNFFQCTDTTAAADTDTFETFIRKTNRTKSKRADQPRRCLRSILAPF